MSTSYRLLFNGALTRIDPERAHNLGFRALRAAESVTSRSRLNRLGDPVDVMGLRFQSVLGLAAGFDKNGVGIDALSALGFGHVEIGTVTGEPQAGNPKPRLFRLPADRAIINRMGFNNHGAEVVARRLAARASRSGDPGPSQVTSGAQEVTPRPQEVTPRRGVVGVNIGKTKVVSEADAIGDYTKSARLLAPWADYLVVNVSSPNTPGLRDLQAVEKLEPLLSAVRRAADAVTTRRVPLLVKIAPDLTDDEVVAVADLALDLGLDGIIATNTTIRRDGLRSIEREVSAIGGGGLSGPPLAERSLAVLRLLRDRAGADLTLISVGGIVTPGDAAERLAAGADLIQAYTAFVYEGPMWPRTILHGLHHLTTGEAP